VPRPVPERVTLAGRRAIARISDDPSRLSRAARNLFSTGNVSAQFAPAIAAPQRDVAQGLARSIPILVVAAGALMQSRPL
jgi:hypothetical protein